MEQIRGLHTGLNALETTCGLPKTGLAELFDFKDASATVRPTEFYGFSPLDAAKRYLKKKGADGAAFSEIVAAVRSGGCPVTPTEESVLRTSLSRSTIEVAKIGDSDFYGLVEFFPHVKRGRKKGVKEAADAILDGADIDQTVEEMNDGDQAQEVKSKT
jgi:hypothetical protein